MTKIHIVAADDLSAEVYLNEQTGRFHVVLRDTDADMVLPVVKIFRDSDAAIAYAETLVA